VLEATGYSREEPHRLSLERGLSEEVPRERGEALPLSGSVIPGRRSRAHTTATLTLWIGGSESNKQSNFSPPSLPIQSWPVVVPK